jgi:signal transduction histidine kinase
LSDASTTGAARHDAKFAVQPAETGRSDCSTLALMTSLSSESADGTGTEQTATVRSSSASAFLEQLDHDLRTPLGTMAAAVELLRDELPGSQAHAESIAVLERQIARMHLLTQKLRDFSQSTAR